MGNSINCRDYCLVLVGITAILDMRDRLNILNKVGDMQVLNMTEKVVFENGASQLIMG